MQKVKRIFISGPVTGIRNYYENFNRAAMALESKFPFAQIVNPAAICGEMPESDWNQYMGITMALLRDCNTIYLLKGWVDSKGARTELRYALLENLEIMLEE